MAGTGRGRRGSRLRRAALCVTIGTALAAGTAACGTAAHPADPARPGNAGVSVLAAQAGTISETGSGLLYPLMRSWAAAYQQGTPGVTVSTCPC